MTPEYQYILYWNGNTETLSISPAGWDRLGVTFIRNEFYHSILRNMSLTLRFPKRSGGGGDFIITAYNSNGIYADVRITINKRNHSTNAFELFYYGSLDFLRRTIERDFVEIGIMDGMKQQKLISRDTINFNLFSTVSADNVNVAPFQNEHQIMLTPIDIILRSEGECSMDNAKGIGYYTSYEGNSCTPTLPEFTVNNIDGERFKLTDENGIVWKNTSKENINLIINWAGSYSIKLHITLKNTPSESIDILYAVQIFNKDGEIISEQKIIYGRLFKSTADPYDYLSSMFPSPNIVYVNSNEESTEDFHEVDSGFNTPLHYTLIYGNFNVYINQPNLPPESYVVIKNIYAPRLGSGEDALWIQTGNINFGFIEKSTGKENTLSKCMFPHEAFTRLIQQLTSETDTSKLLDSEFFGRTNSEFTTYAQNGTGALDAILSGWMMRNYPNAPITCNLRDLFKTFDSIYNLMLGYDRVNDKFYIKEKSYAYNANYFMFDLGEVKSLKVSTLNEVYFSKLISGFDNQAEYEELQGAFEFNVQREYSLSPPVKADKDIRSKYNTDSIGIELARRRQYYDNSSLDTKYDKNIYIVRTNGTTPILDNTITGFDGIGKYYNTMLSPRQNAVRWGNVIAAALYKTQNPVKFQYNAKQISMNYSGIDELSDIAYSELPLPLFIPEKYEFDSYVNTAILTILNTDPHGFITFSYNGKRYAGFLDKLESGDYNKQAKYELIAANIDMQALTADATDVTTDNEYITVDQTIRL